MPGRYIVFACFGFLPRIKCAQAAYLVAAALIRPACTWPPWCPAVNLARGSRPVLRRNPPAVLNARSVFPAAFSRCVLQLVHVKNPGLARGYAGRFVRAALYGPRLVAR